MKKIILIALATSFLGFTACTALRDAAAVAILRQLTNDDIANALKLALQLGIGNGVDGLSKKGGLLNSAYKILLPKEVQPITEKLRQIGLGGIENSIVEKINSGAESAAGKAAPIFLDALKNMTITDAMSILMGDKNSATNFLRTNTSDKLYQAFSPIIASSLDEFGARKAWTDAVGTYNKIPFVQKMNPSLDDYVTKQTMNAMFSMVETKERSIRANPEERTTDLMKQVFAKQDGK